MPQLCGPIPIPQRSQKRRAHMTTSDRPERQLDLASSKPRQRSAPRLENDRPSFLTVDAAITYDNPQRSNDGGHNAHDSAPRVVWTRSAQCRALAEVLGGGTAHKADANVAAACIEARAGLLVTRHLNSFDLCNVAVPHGFTPDTTRSVVAAVGSGPHSHLAAIIAHRLSHQLGIPARALYGRRPGDEQPQAQAALAAIASNLPDLAVETIEADNPAAMVSSLPTGTLLVVGAPGGSWFQRQFFGPGARIQAKAPNGTIVVKHAPTRVYQIMQPPTAFGPHMRVSDAAQLAAEQHVIVALDGQLLGIVYTPAIHQFQPDHELQDVMDEPVLLNPDEDLAHATEVMANHGSPIPVVDAHRRLIGTVTATKLNHPPL